MTWTRLDDNWMADEAFDPLTIYDRWHYLAMIQFCSRGKRYTGVMPRAEAETCSTAPDKPGILAKLIKAELVTELDEMRVQIVRIADHVPSAELLEKLAQDRDRAARHRKHKRGEHDECSPKHCKEAASRDASRQSSRDARNGYGTETGQAVTGSTSDPDSHLAHDPKTEAEWHQQDHQQVFSEDYGNGAT